MPTNLPPDYFAAEEKFRAARSVEEKIAYLEEMISIVPKHKGTDHLRADLRRRMSQLKSGESGAKGKGSHQGSPFHIDREGAGQIVLVGMPNVGKSALVKRLTHATPEVAPQPYTTWVPTPGMMPIENIQVQLIDTPPLNPDYIQPEMIDLIRRADLMLIVVDLQGFPLEQLDESTTILADQRIVPACLRDGITGDGQPPQSDLDLAFVPALVAVNKTDADEQDEDYEVLQELIGDTWPMVPISADNRAPRGSVQTCDIPAPGHHPDLRQAARPRGRPEFALCDAGRRHGGAVRSQGAPGLCVPAKIGPRVGRGRLRWPAGRTRSRPSRG